MAIKISGGRAVPAFQYDQFWLDRMVFFQDRKTGRRDIEMNAAWSATPNNVRSFDSDNPIDTINIADVDASIVGKAIADGVATDPADAMAQIAAARAAAFSAYSAGTLTDLDLMVYFEMAIGALAQMKGVGTIISVE